MSNAIVRDFSFARDFRSIAWGATLKHNLLRAFCAGIVLSVFGFIMGGNQPSVPGGQAQFSTGLLLGMPFMFPIMFLVILLPMGIVCAKLSPHLPFVGIIAIFFAVLVAVGDPLVCILSVFAPQVVPMHKPGIFMLSLIVWLLKGEEVDVDVAVSDQRKINRL